MSNAEHAKGTSEVARNNLSFVDKYKVAQWLGNKQEWLRKELPSFNKVAEVCSKDLGLVLTGNNIKSIATDTQTIWKPKDKAKGGLQPVYDALKELTDKLIQVMEVNNSLNTKINALEAQLAIIRGTIVTICKEANLKTTPAFAALDKAGQTAVVNRQV